MTQDMPETQAVCLPPVAAFTDVGKVEQKFANLMLQIVDISDIKHFKFAVGFINARGHRIGYFGLITIREVRFVVEHALDHGANKLGSHLAGGLLVFSVASPGRAYPIVFAL